MTEIVEILILWNVANFQQRVFVMVFASPFKTLSHNFDACTTCIVVYSGTFLSNLHIDIDWVQVLNMKHLPRISVECIFPCSFIFFLSLYSLIQFIFFPRSINSLTKTHEWHGIKQAKTDELLQSIDIKIVYFSSTLFQDLRIVQEKRNLVTWLLRHSSADVKWIESEERIYWWKWIRISKG